MSTAGLDGHVDTAEDAGAGQGLGIAVLGAHGHQGRHLGFGDGDFAAAPLGQVYVGDLVVGAGFDLFCCAHIWFLQ